MKKILPTIIIALFLSGCAAFAQFRNPIGPTQLAQIESTYALVLNAAVAYRKTCAQRILPREQCAPVVAKLQVADKTVQVTLKEVRRFIKANPTLDASSLISGLRGTVAIFQEIAFENGLRIGN